MVKSESSKCQLCENDELRLVSDQNRDGVPAEILECQKCGLIFQKHLMDIDETYRFYRQEFPGNYQYRAEINQTRYALIEHLLNPSVDVLEVGCSSGEFLNLIRNRVRSACGVELVPHDIQTARRRYGLTVYDCPVEELSLDRSFDLIIAFQTFEHVPLPNECLQSLHRMLRAGGRLILEVPNVKEPLLSLYHVDVFMRFYFVRQHLFYYSQETLPRMLAKNGFIPGRPRLIQMGTLTNHLHWIHKRGPQKDLAEVCNVILPEDVQSSEALDVLRLADRVYREALVARGYSDVLWIEAERE